MLGILYSGRTYECLTCSIRSVHKSVSLALSLPVQVARQHHEHVEFSRRAEAFSEESLGGAEVPGRAPRREGQGARATVGGRGRFPNRRWEVGNVR